MTGSVAIDVVIGLIFIYLLYSLLATVLLEIIATNFGLRSRTLYLGIIKMLSDKGGWKSSSFVLVWLHNLSDRGAWRKEKTDDLAAKFYGSPLIRHLSSGWWFSKPSAISSALFASNMIKIISESAVLPQASLKEGVKSYFEQGGSGDTFNHLQFLYKDAGEDVEKFRARLEGWYNEMMDRVTGWYKKRSQVLLFVIGFAVAAGFNADSIYIAKTLANDTGARKNMIDLVGGSVPRPDPMGREATGDPGNTEEAMKTYLAALQKQKAELQTTIDQANTLLGRGSWLPDTLTLKPGDAGSYHYPNWIDPRALPKRLTHRTTGALVAFSWDEKLSYLLLLSWYHLPGFVLTAIAISFGAPFWFDLLGKLMQLRGSVSGRSTVPGTMSPEEKNPS